jgi:membrane protein required for colicin V production
MIIDIAFVIIMILAIFKGFKKGLIVGIFSLLAFIIGLAAALKLSVVVAEYLKDSAGAFAKWLPLISFMLVFIAVILLVGLLSRVIKKTVQFAMLGWLDKMGGIILYVIIYTIIFSVILFFAAKLLLIQPTTIHDSKIYPYVSPWGPKVIDNFGKIIPIFKDMFVQLQDFFGNMAKKAS